MARILRMCEGCEQQYDVLCLTLCPTCGPRASHIREERELEEDKRRIAELEPAEPVAGDRGFLDRMRVAFSKTKFTAPVGGVTSKQVDYIEHERARVMSSFGSVPKEYKGLDDQLEKLVRRGELSMQQAHGIRDRRASV